MIAFFSVSEMARGCPGESLIFLLDAAFQLVDSMYILVIPQCFHGTVKGDAETETDKHTG